MAVFAFIGAVTPGPVNIIAASAGASFGFCQTFPYVLGVTISYTLIVFLMTTGLSSLFLLIPEIVIIMQYIGAGFLLYMAYKIASSPVAEQMHTNKPTQFD
jgi:threonine/homoserine/homoserine lactone efflux protein